jgi:hypothetical protein
MESKEFYSGKVTILKKETVSSPQYLGGLKIKALGLPVDMSGSTLSFFGTYDGYHWFSINSPQGKTFTIPTRIEQKYTTKPGALSAGEAMLPLSPENSAIFEGIMTVELVGDVPESEDRQITIYYEK